MKVLAHIQGRYGLSPDGHKIRFYEAALWSNMTAILSKAA